MNYFNQPPQPERGRPTGNIPLFIKKHYKGTRYDSKYVLDLFRWGEREYTDVVKQNDKLYSFVKSLTLFTVVAMSKEFADLIRNMNDELWNSLPNSVKNAMRETYSIYKGV